MHCRIARQNQLIMHNQNIININLPMILWGMHIFAKEKQQPVSFAGSNLLSFGRSVLQSLGNSRTFNPRVIAKWVFSFGKSKLNDLLTTAASHSPKVWSGVVSGFIAESQQMNPTEHWLSVSSVKIVSLVVIIMYTALKFIFFCTACYHIT